MSLSLISNQAKPSDPLREALATALKEANEAHQSVERQRAAIGKTCFSLREAERSVKTAEDGVEKAIEAHAQELAAAAADDVALPPSQIRLARQSVVDAQDEAAALKVALAQLKADLPLWEDAAHAADVEIDRRISEILVAPARALVARAVQLEAELAPLRHSLATLRNDRIPKTTVDSASHERSRAPLKEVTDGLMKFGAWCASGPDRWAAAREALRRDPQAPLGDFTIPPTVPSDIA